MLTGIIYCALVQLNDKKSEEIKISKINKINQYCSCLSNSELDFIIDMLYVMTNHSIK